MKAMILAAGRGERMQPLTLSTPKPLLPAAGKPLIEYCIENLVKAGFADIVINLSHLGHMIKDYCGNGERWGGRIGYSDEGEIPLETAGGIALALPLLGPEPFLVINADIVCDFPLETLHHRTIDLAHLVMIKNPPHHPEGDFSIDNAGHLSHDDNEKLTFSGIGVYNPALFAGVKPEPQKMRPILNRAIDAARLTGEYYGGLWMDIGTPERLKEIENLLLKRNQD